MHIDRAGIAPDNLDSLGKGGHQRLPDWRDAIYSVEFDNIAEDRGGMFHTLHGGVAQLADR